MKPTSLLTVILAGASLAACNPAKQASEAAPPRPVLAVAVHYAPRERAQALPGVVKARVESELSFRVGGRLERRLVDAGAFVHRGDPLALLDKTDLQLQLEQAEAERAAALSAVSQAGAEEARIVTLARQGWAAGSDLDKTRSVADQARAIAVAEVIVLGNGRVIGCDSLLVAFRHLRFPPLSAIAKPIRISIIPTLSGFTDCVPPESKIQRRSGPRCHPAEDAALRATESGKQLGQSPTH